METRTREERELSQGSYRESLQRRIDECEETKRVGSTGDPERPYSYVTALDAIIDCHRRILREMDEDDTRQRR